MGLEGVKNRTFHAVNRYSVHVKSFKAIGLYLVKLSRLELSSRKLY